MAGDRERLTGRCSRPAGRIVTGKVVSPMSRHTKILDAYRYYRNERLSHGHAHSAVQRADGQRAEVARFSNHPAKPGRALTTHFLAGEEACLVDQACISCRRKAVSSRTSTRRSMGFKAVRKLTRHTIAGPRPKVVVAECRFEWPSLMATAVPIWPWRPRRARGF